MDRLTASAPDTHGEIDLPSNNNSRSHRKGTQVVAVAPDRSCAIFGCVARQFNGARNLAGIAAHETDSGRLHRNVCFHSNGDPDIRCRTRRVTRPSCILIIEPEFLGRPRALCKSQYRWG